MYEVCKKSTGCGIVLLLMGAPLPQEELPEELQKYLEKYVTDYLETKSRRSKQTSAERIEQIRSLWSRYNAVDNLFLTVQVEGSDVQFLLHTEPEWIEAEPERSQFLELRETCRRQLMPYKEETIKRKKSDGDISAVPHNLETVYEHLYGSTSVVKGPYVYFLVWWNILTWVERAEADWVGQGNNPIEIPVGKTEEIADAVARRLVARRAGTYSIEELSVSQPDWEEIDPYGRLEALGFRRDPPPEAVQKLTPERVNELADRKFNVINHHINGNISPYDPLDAFSREVLETVLTDEEKEKMERLREEHFREQAVLKQEAERLKNEMGLPPATETNLRVAIQCLGVHRLSEEQKRLFDSYPPAQREELLTLAEAGYGIWSRDKLDKNIEYCEGKEMTQGEKLYLRRQPSVKKVAINGEEHVFLALSPSTQDTLEDYGIDQGLEKLTEDEKQILAAYPAAVRERVLKHAAKKHFNLLLGSEKIDLSEKGKPFLAEGVLRKLAEKTGDPESVAKVEQLEKEVAESRNPEKAGRYADLVVQGFLQKLRAPHVLGITQEEWDELNPRRFSAITRYIHNAISPYEWDDGERKRVLVLLTDEEKRLLERLREKHLQESGRYYSGQPLLSHDRSVWEMRAKKELLAQYMILYLQRFNSPIQTIEDTRHRVDEITKHQQIREHFTEHELEIIDKMSAPEVWKQIATNPEIVRLLSEITPSLDTYMDMTQQEKEEAAIEAVEQLLAASSSGSLMIFAPSGWGKSRLLGRGICPLLPFLDPPIGTVVIDVVGATIDNTLDRFIRLMPQIQDFGDDEHEEHFHTRVAEKLRYCNMAGEWVDGEVYVPAFSMLAKQYENENLYTRSQRIVDLIRKTDSNLSNASIQGLNRIAPLLTSIAIILAEAELPLSRTFDLLEQPEQVEHLLNTIDASNPEVMEAALFLRAFLHLPQREQEQRSEVLRNKLSFLRFDSVSRAMFSAQEPMFTWEEVAEEKLQVYIDFRNERSQEAFQMKLFWVWNSLMEFVKSRGASGREKPPLAVVIDELSYFVRGTQLNTEVISEEFREFVQVRRRNANIQLTAATQERSELPSAMQSACLQLPNHLYGGTSDPETAVENAKRWYRKEAKRMKARGRLYLLQMRPGLNLRQPPSKKNSLTEWLTPLEEIVDETPPAYMSYQDQDYENSRMWLDLPKGEWLFGQSKGEGQPATELQHITTEMIDPGKYVQEDMVADFRCLMSQSHGIPVSQVLAELYEPLVPPTDEEAAAPPHDMELRGEIQDAGEQPLYPDQERETENPSEEPPDDMGRRRRGSA